MNLTLILVFVLVAVVVYATTLWKKIAKLEQGLRAETRLLEDRRDELEKAKKDSRERREELEEAKKQLTEARNKLKKRERDEQPQAPAGAGGGKKAKGPAREEPAAPTPMIVRISDQEVATEHQRALQKLDDEIAALRTELATVKKRDEQRTREAAAASKALDAAMAAPAPPPPTREPMAAQSMEAPAQVSEDIAALRAQLDALKKAAVDRERELKREIRKAHDETKHALRRASNNQALYAVLHGQLELAEDRLAAYKLKYEGAKSIDELRREAKRDRPKKQRDRRGQNGEPPSGEEATIPPPADEEAAKNEPTVPPSSNEAAPSTIEVAKEDIVSQHPAPADTVPPEPAKREA